MNWDSPGWRLAAILIGAALLVGWTIKVALVPVRWDYAFREGDRLESPAGTVVLQALDFLSEPGEIFEHEALRQFYVRQNEIHSVASGPALKVTRGEETQTLASRAGGVGDLAGLFWLQVIVGLGAVFISGGIWALRSRDLASALFAFSGFSVFISALPSAVYTTRELAIGAPLLQILEEINATGAALFGLSMIAMFLVYPVRLRNWRWWTYAELAVFGGWTILFLLKWVPEVMGISLLIVTLLLAILVAIAAQFFATRGNPQARASLTWLGLSVVIGAGAFVVLNTVPSLIGTTPLHQGYAFCFFLIIYLGLAAGLTRFRLFEVGQWAFRFLYYAAGALLFVVLDAALVIALGMDRWPALGLALLTIGFVYIPMRDYLWRLFTRRGRMESPEMLAEALHVAFAPSSEARASRWEALLRKFFDPLEIQPAHPPREKVEITEDGLALVIPAVASAPSLKLSYPWSGRALFTPQSRDWARQIVALIDGAESSREAYDRGVSEERLRLARDLHDDVSARLLTGLYQADEKLKPTLQGALADIRAIVSGMSGERFPLTQLLSDLRHETSERLRSARVEMDWPLAVNTHERSLDYYEHKTIRSAFREIVSNVIRHSKATKLAVRIESDSTSLCFEFHDDGCGIPSAAANGESTGFGLKNLRQRIAERGGKFEVFPRNPGAGVRIFLPSDAND